MGGARDGCLPLAVGLSGSRYVCTVMCVYVGKCVWVPVSARLSLCVRVCTHVSEATHPLKLPQQPVATGRMKPGAYLPFLCSQSQWVWSLLVDRVWHMDAGQGPAIPEDLGCEAAMGSNSPKKSHRDPPGCHPSAMAGWASSE